MSGASGQEPQASMVSALVCTYNRSASLRETLQALQRQTMAPGRTLEIIVVDNNSTDETPRVVSDAAQGSRWPIRYLFEATQGKCHALNRGIQAAQGGLLVFTDDDVVPEPEWAASLSRAVEEFDADCVGGRVLPLWSAPPPSWLAGQQDLLSILALVDRGPAPFVATLRDAYFIYGANLALRKTIFDQVGLFRTDLGPNGRQVFRGDDTEFVTRAFQLGKRVVYTPQAVVHHRVPAERMRMGYFRRWSFNRGRAQVRMAESPERGVPRWLIRRCVECGAQALWAYGRGRRELGRQRELAFWQQLGEILERLR